MNFLILFICVMIIPIINISSVFPNLASYKIDFIYSTISFGISGIAAKYLKKNEHPIIIILIATFAEDLIINLLCDIKFITYIIQAVIIIVFAIYIDYKSRL